MSGSAMSTTDPKPATTWRVLGIDLPVGAPESEVRDRACRAVGVDPAALRGFRIVKKALDARRRGGVRRLRFVVHADLVLDADFRSQALSRARRSGHVERAPEPEEAVARRVHRSLLHPRRALPALRARLEAAGVRCAWNVRLEELVHAARLVQAAGAGYSGRILPAGGRVKALSTSAGEIECDAVVLALGHSARDTWTQLQVQGVAFEAKPFQLGLRIEHPAELIDRAQLGVGPE